MFNRRAVLHHCPQEPDEFTSDGDNRDLRLFPKGEMAIPLMQSLLRFPRMRDHSWRLSRLPPFQVGADSGPMMVAPGRLNEHVPTVAVAGFGN
jgi:hypothetical protein